jgi:putative nucleotidyltransferase with HDIG domain
MNQLSSAMRLAQLTGDLPPMPHIARLVVDKVGDPKTTAKDLQDIIQQDQALAARVLKIANSAFYGFSRSVTSLTGAIGAVGFNTIKSMVVSSVVRDLFKTFGLTEQLLWEHSLGCAFAARRIAREVRFPKFEEAFLAGLLHDIGKVILYMRLPQQMSAIIQAVYNNPGAAFFQLERTSFGFDHAQLGQLVARKWNFAEEIEEAIGAHHFPETARKNPQLATIINLANFFCHRLQIGITKNPDMDVAGLKSAAALKLSQGAIEDLVHEIETTFGAEKANFMN